MVADHAVPVVSGGPEGCPGCWAAVVAEGVAGVSLVRRIGTKGQARCTSTREGQAVSGKMPVRVRRGLFWAAVALAVVAAAGNFGHVYDFATDPGHGATGQRMGGVVALLPDVLLILCLVKLRYDLWSVQAWFGLVRIHIHPQRRHRLCRLEYGIRRQNQWRQANRRSRNV